MRITLMRTVGAIAVISLLALAGCGAPKYEITHVGPAGPPQPPGCPLQVTPGPPPMPVEDIAIIKVRCARGQCQAQLNDRACEMGAQVLHSVHSLRGGAYHQGTAALFAQGAQAQPPNTAPAPPPPAGY